ncbi:hypothetical protein GCM10023311_03230 [Flaviramulus aquimarinus]|uniref:HMA domain-containing protein n=1 Tax=Flaviramulus aquimarinus TaxID=1170456 RepID=A0ABP9EQJ4_9FLAO
MKSTLYIQNLKCKGCGITIKEKLSKFNKICNVSVDTQHTLVKFECASKNDVEYVKKCLSKIGYPPYGEKNDFLKKANSFVSCAIGKTHKQI